MLQNIMKIECLTYVLTLYKDIYNMPSPNTPHCCPDGYYYNFDLATCASLDFPTVYTTEIDCCCPEGASLVGNDCFFPLDDIPVAKVPCKDLLPEPLPCDCVTLPEPECPECGTKGLHTSFTLNLNEKTCTNCSPEDDTLTKDKKLNIFIPAAIIKPVINFKLD